MGRDDWCRREQWTAKDEAEFRARNRRSRGNDSKAQYLRIQAETLYRTEKPELLEPALALAEECLGDYPTAEVSRAMALDLAGRCCERLGRLNEAIDYYRSALAFEKEFPGVQTLACFHFARLVTEHRLMTEYDTVLQALSDFGPPVFPWHAYMLNAIAALILAERGDVEDAQKKAQVALEAAGVTVSGLSHGRGHLGLVDAIERKSEFFQRLLELA